MVLILAKREDLSPVRSYKLRGAFNSMRKQQKINFLLQLVLEITQGVSYMCKHFGVKGTIFMPVTTPKKNSEDRDFWR